jgi:hypothetical protein
MLSSQHRSRIFQPAPCLKVDNTISAYSVNSSTGMPFPLNGSPFSGNLSAPTDIVMIAKQ